MRRKRTRTDKHSLSSHAEPSLDNRRCAKLSANQFENIKINFKRIISINTNFVMSFIQTIKTKSRSIANIIGDGLNDYFGFYQEVEGLCLEMPQHSLPSQIHASSAFLTLRSHLLFG